MSTRSALLPSKIRPVGNHLRLISKPLNESVFGGFKYKLFSSGTSALAAAILAAKTRQQVAEPEIILPAYTCPDVISAAAFCGVTPVLVDLEPNTCWMSLTSLREAINTNTIAIIAINFLGIPERISKIRELLPVSSITIIEDSAQGFPSDLEDSYWQGDLVTLSFGRGKPLGLLSGGAVLTKSDNWYDYISDGENNNILFAQFKYRLKRLLYNFLQRPVPYYFISAIKFLNIGETIYKPLNKIETMPLFVQGYLREAIHQYSASRSQYLLFNAIEELNDKRVINLSKISHSNRFPLLRFPLLITDKELRHALIEQLALYGVSTMYKVTLSEIQSIPRQLLNGQKQTEKVAAQQFAKQLITLPCHHDVSENLVKKIVSIIRDNCKQ